MKTIKLDIDQISDELYNLILKELIEQNPEAVGSSIDKWSFTAEVNEDQHSSR